jgi:hypothetical protein
MRMPVGAVLLVVVAGLLAAGAGAAWANTVSTSGVDILSGYEDLGGGLWGYAYQIHDPVEFFPLVQIPDPGNVDFTSGPPNAASLNPFFSAVPGANYNPIGFSASGHPSAIPLFPGYITFGISAFNLSSDSVIWGFTAPDAPAFEDAIVTFSGGTLLENTINGPGPFQVWGPAPEPPSAVLVGGGLVMILCGLASLKGKRKAGVHGSFLA